jgi:hypothetical protein
MKLHQFLALQADAKGRGEGDLTKAFQAVDKTALLSGVSKTYASRTEDGYQLPAEGTKLQLRVPVIMADAIPAMIRQFDIQATVDGGNQIAKADVVVNGVTVLTDVPVETLLFLEKKMVNLVQFIERLPVLDEAEDWEDAGDLSFKSKPSSKARTDKVPERFVKAAATDKHPAQVEILYLDQPVGDWTTIKFSGAITPARKRDLLSKAQLLQAAVKVARAEANSTEVTDKKIGTAIFDFLGWVD